MTLHYPEVEPSPQPIARPQPSLARAIKMALIAYYGYVCQGCLYQFPHPTPDTQQYDGTGFELDHRIPIARGGLNTIENLWILCLPCHDGKTNFMRLDSLPENMTDEEWIHAGRPQDWTRKNRLMERRRATIATRKALHNTAHPSHNGQT